MVIMCNNGLSLSFNRKGKFRIHLTASNALDDGEDAAMTIQVTDMPNCYPPTVSIIGNRAEVNVAKCNLGKVRFEPMQSAVLFVVVRDLWDGPQVLAGWAPVVQYI